MSGNWDLVFFKGVRIDNRHVDAPQIEQRVHVFHRTAGHDRQDKHVRTVVDDARDLGSKAYRRTLKLAAGQS